MARRDDDSERYREAALMTLHELDWCAQYLKRIHKPKLARQIEINVATIRQRVDGPNGDAVTRPRVG